MNRTNLTPAPVGPQGPPTRAAAMDPGRSLRVARGPRLWTTGTACAVLDGKSTTDIRERNQKGQAHRNLTEKQS